MVPFFCKTQSILDYNTSAQALSAGRRKPTSNYLSVIIEHLDQRTGLMFNLLLHVL